MGSEYDLVIVGGGLGGATLAKCMAERGTRVLVIERETRFKDRVRGEGMTTWGAGEARELGIYDLLTSTCAHEVPWWDIHVGPMQVLHREMPATSPQGLPTLTFYHPEMQETLLAAAEKAGAEVRRGAQAQGILNGNGPGVSIGQDGRGVESVRARLVVGVDGRGSLMRRWAGFTEQRDPERLMISGVLLENSRAPDFTVRLVNDFEHGHAAILFPQGRGRARTYFVRNAGEGARLQGEKDFSSLVRESIATGMPAEYFEGAGPAGPLATFSGAATYVEHPYRNGVALVGDAAASSDPSWGQGLGLTLRDVRTLRDALLANDDWDAAGHAYAKEHDRYFGVLHTVEDWFTTLSFETGPEGDARRARAFSRIAEDRSRQPDTIFTGPDHEVSETIRRRFFGDD
jgi:2-polyprenyl-6-methoxyphenol hydroxylase-like FAD-dependent oxidoreductase